MSFFDRTMEEFTELLQAKGYDEKSLASPDKEGWMIRQLELFFSKSIRDAQAHSEKQTFELQGVGFFNEEMDVILFKFHYEYDPAAPSLSITQLDARMGKETLSYPVAKPAYLPAAGEVYTAFVRLSKMESVKKMMDAASAPKNHKRKL